ncbi:MAG: hypothetical protein QMC82_05335 [Methanolinea sp.]|nr:hypothetical protein [Methanolinea sp.]
MTAGGLHRFPPGRHRSAEECIHGIPGYSCKDTLIAFARTGKEGTQAVAPLGLVHGGNMPGGLPGRPCRDGTIPFPASRGHAALAPALPDGRTTGLSGHGAQVIGLARERCAGGVIPAGDSGDGREYHKIIHAGKRKVFV